MQASEKDINGICIHGHRGFCNKCALSVAPAEPEGERCAGCGHPSHAPGCCPRVVGREMYSEACHCGEPPAPEGGRGRQQAIGALERAARGSTRNGCVTTLTVEDCEAAAAEITRLRAERDEARRALEQITTAPETPPSVRQIAYDALQPRSTSTSGASDER